MIDQLQTPLLPCPFCGSHPVTEHTGFSGRAMYIYCINDNGCPRPKAIGESEEKAIGNWNTRAAHRNNHGHGYYKVVGTDDRTHDYLEVMFASPPPQPDTAPVSGRIVGGAAPCPFCGAPAKLGDDPLKPVLYCDNDDCFGPHTTAGNLDDAIRQWNTRHQPDTAPSPLSTGEVRALLTDIGVMRKILAEDIINLHESGHEAAARGRENFDEVFAECEQFVLASQQRSRRAMANAPKGTCLSGYHP